MKKIIKLLACIAAATVAFSCMEEANPETPAAGESNYDGPTVTLEFKVSKEDTKTFFDGEQNNWVAGDEIKIIYTVDGAPFYCIGIIDADEDEKGVVKAAIAEGADDTYYAVYPSTTVYELANGELSVVFPKTQDGTFSQANIMAAKTTIDEKKLAFKNLTHIFKFTLSEDSKYKGFQFMSNSSASEENEISILMTGVVPVTFNDDEEGSITLGTPETKTIGEVKYELSSVVQVSDLEPGGTYYVGFHPSVNMDYGFGFKATKTAGVTNWSEGALSTTPLVASRSSITNITNLDQAIRPNLFFKADGTGDGSNWENAGGVDLLVKLLGDEIAEGVKYNKNTNGWRLYGANLHLAAGTYTLPKTIAFQIAVNNKTAVYGGYPTNLTGTKLENRDASANKTIISKDGGSRHFAGNGSTLYNWTWDGITFTFEEGTTTTDRGGIFYFNNSTKGTVKFVNCTFENIETTHGNGGGAFDFNTQNQEFKATFTNCNFTNNKAKLGGAIVVEDGRKSKISFEDCNFSNNTATSAGGAIANRVGTIIVDGCTFTDNYSTAHGGAICTYGEEISGNATIEGATANAYIYNSLFDNNDVSSSSQGGSIKVHGNGNLVVVNSTFRKSDASTGIIRLRSQVAESVKAWVIGCTFSDNNKNSFYNQSSLAYIYNTVMNDNSSFIANQATGGTSFWNTIVFNTSYYNIASGELPGKNALTTLTDIKTLDATVVGDFENGVYSVTGAALTDGMSSEDLAALGAEGSALMTAMPLFDAEKLKVDQKGNSRAGKTVMGAYVGE